MKRILSFCLLLMLQHQISFAQVSSISFTNTTASDILKGLYTPADYNGTGVQNIPDSIVKGIMTRINQDSMKAYWLKLGTFYNRNTGNQLVSSTQGITASIDWVNSKFQEFRAANNNRLVVSNLTFVENVCGRNNHKEPLAIIPGNRLTDKSIMVICAHIDSRTESLCPGSTIEARGMEDNATGVAAVMELARVMSRYSFSRTIVFLITTAEEQTLGGSDAFVRFCKANAIPVRGNINNDQLGTMICRTPASTPGCSVNNSVDTTSLRIFSRIPATGTFNNSAKSWTRFIKQTYVDKALPTAAIPMNVRIMTNIDRDGRGGDHEPFDTAGFPAARLMCANEAGNGSGTNSRIHTTKDIGGADTNTDGMIDSFFVSFGYLQRNNMINGLALAQAANAQTTPTYTITNIGNNNIRVVINTQTTYPTYRVGVRTTSYDYDSVYNVSTTTSTIVIPVSPNGRYYISVAGMDTNNVTTFFGIEREVISSLTTLSVNYVGFTAKKKDNTSELQFTIAAPVVGSIFYIERSTDGKDFISIGEINSTIQDKNYSFVDSLPINNKINYYRIVEININGKKTISNIAYVKFTKEETIDVYPVPASTTVNIVFNNNNVAQQKPTTILLYNNVGQLILTKKVLRTNGNEQLDVSGLKNGMYVIKILTEVGTINKTIQVLR